MLNLLLGCCLMALEITHSYPPFAGFSASGSAAYEAPHTVTGLAAVATSGAYADVSGTPVLAAVATSGAYSSLTGTPSIPNAIFKFIAVTGQGTIGATTSEDTLRVSASSNITIATDTAGKAITISAAGGGSELPVGFVFISRVATDPSTLFGYGTWSLIGQGQVLVGILTGHAEFGTLGQTGGATGIAASGTVTKPVFTGDNYTPSGTNAVVQFTPSGTNAVVQFTPSGTNAISLMREAAAGTNAASAVTGSVSGDWAGTTVPTFAGVTASASASVDWPAGTPSVLGSAHQHGIPVFSTGATGISFLATSIYGVGATQTGALRVSVTATGPIVRVTAGTGQVYLSQSVSAAGTVNWPASVPVARVTGLVPAGVISWPATNPAAVAKTLTAAAQVFTGVTGSVSAQVFTGIEGTVSAQVFTGITGTVSGQVFTGVAKAATGTVSKPTFAGDLTSVVQPYLVVYMWERTA